METEVKEPAPWRIVPEGIAIALLALLSSSGSLRNAFTGDDHWIVEYNDRVHALGRAWRLFAETYWPPQNGAALYRPIPMVAYAWQWAMGDGTPGALHAGGMALYACVCLTVFVLARQMLSRNAAWCAAALFAVHPIHAEVTSNVVGQAESWAALWTTLGVILYIHWRRDGELWSRARIGALMAVYCAACLSKESGIVLPLILLAAELTVLRGIRSSWRQRSHTFWPLTSALLATAFVYLVVRRLVVGSLAGDYPTFVFAHASAATRWLTMLGAFPTIARLLLWPVHIAVEYMPAAIAVHTSPDAFIALPLLSLMLVTFVAWRTGAVLPVAAFGLLWAGLAFLPVSNLLLPTGVLLAPRNLFAPSIGIVLAAVAVLQQVEAAWQALSRHQAMADELDTRRVRFRTALGSAMRVVPTALVVLAIALGLARSVDRAAAWRDDFTLVRHTVLDEPQSYLAHDGYGRALLELGEQQAGEAELSRALSLYRFDPGPYVHLAESLEHSAHCDTAITLYRQALQILSTRPDARLGLARCLVQAGDFEGALAEARSGEAYGYDVAAFRKVAAQADAALVVRDSAGTQQVPAPVPP